MKIYLVLLFALLSAIATAQTKIVPVKKNGQYVAPMFNPITGAVSDVVVDSVNFWKPPVVVPPTDDTTKIDGRNGTFVGSWSHAVNTAEGWFKNTLSFSSVAGNTATYRFQGTKLELWGERKSSHGTGVVTIKLGTTVIDTKTVSFVGSTLMPALIYTSPNLTPLTNYTIELKVTSGWNLIDFLTIWNYSNSTAGPDPIDPIPPIGNEIIIQPGQDINNIIKDLPRGSNVRLASGNHTVGKLSIPDGVNFRGSGKGNTFINATPGIWASNNEDAMLYMRGGTGTQVISDMTIKGNNVANGGVFISRNNVSVENLKVENCKFFGLWTTSNSGFKTYELDLINNSWSSVGWCSGELIFGGILSNFDVELGLIQTTTNSKGYAVKILWNDNTFTKNKLINGKIHGGRIDLMHFSLWNNGQSRNISIEIFNCSVEGTLDIYDMIIENQVSLALHMPNPGKIIIRNSTFKLEGDTYTCETVCNNLELRDLQIYEASMIFANFQPNYKINNLVVDRVSFSSPSGNAFSYGGIVLVGPSGATNVVIRNSSIDLLPGFPKVRYMGSPQTGVTFESSTTFY
jgi:hypothetical protein